MAKLNALQAAESIGAWTSTPRILRPHWPNPACEGGVGLEVATDLTIDELVKRYRDKLIALTYYSNVIAAYCAPSQAARSEDAIILDDQRNQTDMIWHTDMVQRKYGSVNIVVGQSTTPTGVAAKPLVTTAARNLVQNNDAQWPLKSLYGHWLDYEELSMLYSDKSSYYLHTLLAATAGEEEGGNEELSVPDDDVESIRSAFWADIQALNAIPDLLWFGSTPEQYAGKEPALFLARTCYHNRGYTPPNAPARDGNKHRLELRPSASLRSAIDGRLEHLRYQDPPQTIDAEWFEAL